MKTDKTRCDAPADSREEMTDVKDRYPRLGDITPQLLERLRDGDHVAFTTVYTVYTDPLMDFLMSILHSREEAEEITQEIFTALWEKRENIDRNTNLKSYLYSSVRNMAFNYLRNKKVKLKHMDYHSAHYSELDLGLEEIIQTKETYLIIEAVMAKMPDQRKKVFELSRKEGLSHQQIAEKLGISVGTVGQHIKLALKTIREVLSLFMLLFI